MTLRRAVFAILLGATVAARAAEPELEFSGVLTADGKTRIALTDKATASTQWVEAGDELKGYAITRYDATEDAVFVRKDGHDYRLPLTAAKTRTESPAPAPAAPPALATANAIRNNLRMLAAAARQFQQDRRVNSVTYADLVGPGKAINELRPVAGESYNTLVFTPAASAVSVTTADGNAVSLALNAAAGLAPAAPAPTTPSPPAAPAAAAAPAPAVNITLAPPPAALAPPAPREQPIASPAREPASPSYVIQGGDTWQKIAESTGVPVRTLQELNPTVNGSSLPSGQTIRIR